MFCCSDIDLFSVIRIDKVYQVTFFILYKLCHYQRDTNIEDDEQNKKTKRKTNETKTS